ncbi:MAG: hypothetical protein WC777_04815 [Candidatus Gracilibacteria bacterium]|jgi:hypothetical protein
MGKGIETGGDVIEIPSKRKVCSFLTLTGLTSVDPEVMAATYNDPKYQDAAAAHELKKGIAVLIETGRGRVQGVLETNQRVIVPDTLMMEAATGVDFPHIGSFWPVTIDGQIWFVSQYLVHKQKE